MQQKYLTALLAFFATQLAFGQVLIDKQTQVNTAQPIGTVGPPTVGTRMLGHIDLQATDAYTTQKGGRLTFSGVYSGVGALTTYAAIQAKKFNTTDANSGGNLEFLTGNNDDGSMNVNLVITDKGNVGIGATSPFVPGAGAAKVVHLKATDFPQYISEASNATTDNKIWRTIVRSGGVYEIQTLDDAGLNEVTALQFTRSGTAVTQALFPNGNVGIGTPTPVTKLQVKDAVSTGTFTCIEAGARMLGGIDVQATDAFGTQKGGRITFSGVYSSAGGLSSYGAIQGKKFNTTDGHSGGGLEFITGNNSTGNMPVNMVIDNLGNVGIGAPTPASKLHVVTSTGGTAATFSDNVNSSLRIQHPSSGVMRFDIDGGNQFSFSVASVERVKITAAGNVGIGTPTPLTPGGAAANIVHLRASDYAQYLSEASNATTNNKLWRTIVRSSGVYQIQTLDDAGGSEVTGMQMTRSGNSITSVAFPNGTVTANGVTVTSDARYKKDVKILEGALSKVIALKGVSYNWRQDEFKDKGFENRSQIGFIAQELKEVLPQAVSTDEKGYYSVNYTMVIPLLTEAIKQQQQEIERMKAEREEMKAQINLINERLNIKSER